MVRISDATKVYRTGKKQVYALDDVSLQVGAGEFAAVQGPSGCGKTTLLLLVGGLLQPDSGTVQVGGQELYAMPLERRARFRAAQIGFVFQQFHLIPYLTVRDNVLAPTMALPAADARSRAEELLERFHLTARAAHTPGELSTGERQRVARARSLLHRPRLILADEPTGNLDEQNAAIVLDALADFAAQGGTVLLVTHDRSAAERAARTVRLEAGRLVADTGAVTAQVDRQVGE